MSFVLYLEVLQNLNGKLTATEKATEMYEPMNGASKNSMQKLESKLSKSAIL